MISEILNILFPVPQQTPAIRIDREVLKEQLTSTFHGADIKLSDPSYKLVDIGHIQKFLERNSGSERKYITTSNDCDDFSFILMGDVTRWDPDLAFGIAWGYNPSGTYHAFNMAIDTTEEVQIVEPQSDEIYVNTEEWDVRFVLM
ncbi:MAG: hypothetical protein M8353_12330 [ANME-2 cluster archaeon]|nr:hypothetical protein [ANME-2 cluster archaeon]